MEKRTANPARLYLPLLVNPQRKIRQCASLIMFSTYGERAVTYLRRLLEDPDREVGQQARLALQNLGDIAGLEVELQPFGGMYVECLGHLRVYIVLQRRVDHVFAFPAMITPTGWIRRPIRKGMVS